MEVGWVGSQRVLSIVRLGLFFRRNVQLFANQLVSCIYLSVREIGFGSPSSLEIEWKQGLCLAQQLTI